MSTASLKSRIPARDDIANTQDAFQGLLAVASIYKANRQNLEARNVLRTALDIALRRWWLVVDNRPNDHFLDAATILTKLRACVVISRSQYDRVKKSLRRHDGITLDMLSELSHLAAAVHQRANDIEAGVPVSER